MITTTTINDIVRHVYLFGTIEGPVEFEDELSRWDAEWNYPNESVVLHINSSGGSVASMHSLILRLSQVKNLYAIAEGDCGSAAFYLYLMADIRAANKYAIFMAHNFMISHGMSAESIGNALDFAEHNAKQGEDMINNFFLKTKFFTKKEVEGLINGKEMHLDYNNAFERGIINCPLNDFPINII